jgi:hypothetical protein
MKLAHFAFALFSASPAALAQTTPPADSPPVTPPAATAPAKPGMFYTRSQGDMPASDLLGATVRNNANEAIGEINELVLSGDGRPAAVIIGVGGFLGLGERELAIDYKALRFEKDAGSIIIKVDATKDALKAAPEWEWPDTPGNPATPSLTPDSAPRQ